MKNIPKILVTPGEPAGIGYDILLDLPKKNFKANIITIASIEILKERADLLEKKINFIKIDINDLNFPKISKNDILVHDLKNTCKVQIGKPNIKHVPLILKSLNLAVEACLKNIANAGCNWSCSEKYHHETWSKLFWAYRVYCITNRWWANNDAAHR